MRSLAENSTIESPDVNRQGSSEMGASWWINTPERRGAAATCRQATSNMSHMGPCSLIYD